MDVFSFILNNSPLCVLAFFGFLAFYKGIPFLIKHNEDRLSKTENKLIKIAYDLHHLSMESKNDKDNIKKDVKEMKRTLIIFKNQIEKIGKYQHTQKGTMSTIESVILKDWKPKDNERTSD